MRIPVRRDMRHCYAKWFKVSDPVKNALAEKTEDCGIYVERLSHLKTLKSNSWLYRNIYLLHVLKIHYSKANLTA
jgi:hypothetical protein